MQSKVRVKEITRRAAAGKVALDLRRVCPKDLFALFHQCRRLKTTAVEWIADSQGSAVFAEETEHHGGGISRAQEDKLGFVALSIRKVREDQRRRRRPGDWTGALTSLA